MKQYLIMALLFSLWRTGFCQEKIKLPNKRVNRGKDSVRVESTYTYDSPHCTLSNEYDKNGKPLTYTYEYEPYKNLKTKKFKRKRK